MKYKYQVYTIYQGKESNFKVRTLKERNFFINDAMKYDYKNYKYIAYQHLTGTKKLHVIMDHR